MTTAGPSDDRAFDRRGLSREQFWSIVALVVLQFLFGYGVIWRHLWDLDASILYSYATIPFLVGGALAWSKRFDVCNLFIDTVEVVSVKFVITATFVMVALIVHGGAQAPAATPRVSPVRAAPEAPTPRMPSVIPADRRGTVAVHVTRAGHPAVGVLVWLEGFDDLVFAPSQTPEALVDDGTGFSPRLVVVEVGQPLDVRSANGELHTLAGHVGRDMVFNYPALASGAPQRVVLTEAYGLVSVECTVQAGRETPSRMLVVAHPFHGFTDAMGTFELKGVPAGTRRVLLLDPSAAAPTAPHEVVVGGGTTSDVTIVIS
jgi:hypothetical protein